MRMLTRAVVIVCLIASVPLQAEPLRQSERDRLVSHLQMTDSWLADELRGLSREQLAFRMTPESWTILDVVEHLAVAEEQYWAQLQKSMQQPAAAFTREATDADILWYGIDRTRRSRTGEPRTPKGRYTDVQAAFDVFRRGRATMLAYAKTTTGDLRGRQLLEGNMDVYQWFVMISSHAQRHILQIREIKADANYPSRTVDTR
jgi:hypothetical protein